MKEQDIVNMNMMLIFLTEMKPHYLFCFMSSETLSKMTSAVGKHFSIVTMMVHVNVDWSENICYLLKGNVHSYSHIVGLNWKSSLTVSETSLSFLFLDALYTTPHSYSWCFYYLKCKLLPNGLEHNIVCKYCLLYTSRCV